jgi:DNA-binding NarL/FixJ family response regulator
MIRILIADDHALVRGGLKQLIATAADLFVAGEAATGEQVLDQIGSLDLDLILLDMSMPGLSGVDLIRRVADQKAGLRILVLSMHNEAPVASRALRAGASGYVTKDSGPEILLAAIRKVAAGEKFIDPALVDAVVFNTRHEKRPAHELLSDRELQVFRMIAVGHSLTDIGELLKLSAKTVSTHKTRLMQKLGIHSNADLVRYAIKHNIIPEQ